MYNASVLSPQSSAPPADALSSYYPPSSCVSSDGIWPCQWPGRARSILPRFDMLRLLSKLSSMSHFPTRCAGHDRVRNRGRLGRVGSNLPNIELQVRSSARASGPVRPSSVWTDPPLPASDAGAVTDGAGTYGAPEVSPTLVPRSTRASGRCTRSSVWMCIMMSTRGWAHMGRNNQTYNMLLPVPRRPPASGL